jgi:gluconokinase
MMVQLPSPVVLVIMGVSGSGKSTLGSLLAERMGWAFEEGDALHPAANVAKMEAGIPLTDEDRWPWLAKVADWIDNRLDTGENGIVTCSALKRSYRNVLNRRGSGVEFVYLAVAKSELEDRVEHRSGHFMPPSLLDSQLATLEPPADSEPAVTVDAGPDARLVVDRVLRDLNLTPQPLAATPLAKTAAAMKTVTPAKTTPSKAAAPDAAAQRSPQKPRPGSQRQNRSPS